MTTSKTKRRVGPWAWAAIGLVLLVVALGVWWLANWDSSPGDDAAGDRMVAAIAAMPQGREVDLAQVLAIPWDRAVLMEPYSDGVAMNERLGFRGFADDASGPMDEANQFVVFVHGQSVVATAGLFPEAGSFRFSQSITEFSRDDARFVVERDGERVTLMRPPVSDAGHAVVLRNEASVPYLVRLLGENDSTAFFELPPRSEAPVTAPPATATLHEVAFLDAGCTATGAMGFGGSGDANHWSDLSMLVIEADGSLGFLLPSDLATWNQTRAPLPGGMARPAAGCVEQ